MLSPYPYYTGKNYFFNHFHIYTSKTKSPQPYHPPKNTPFTKPHPSQKKNTPPNTKDSDPRKITWERVPRARTIPKIPRKKFPELGPKSRKITWKHFPGTLVQNPEKLPNPRKITWKHFPELGPRAPQRANFSGKMPYSGIALLQRNSLVFPHIYSEGIGEMQSEKRNAKRHETVWFFFISIVRESVRSQETV